MELKLEKIKSILWHSQFYIKNVHYYNIYNWQKAAICSLISLILWNLPLLDKNVMIAFYNQNLQHYKISDFYSKEIWFYAQMCNYAKSFMTINQFWKFQFCSGAFTKQFFFSKSCSSKNLWSYDKNITTIVILQHKCVTILLQYKLVIPSLKIK